MLVRIESISSPPSCTSVSRVLESTISWVNSPLRSASTWRDLAGSPPAAARAGRRGRRWCPTAGPGPASEVRTSSGVSAKVSDSTSKELASCAVSISLDRRRQVGERLDHVVRRRGAVERDRLVGVELGAAARHERQVLRAQHRLDLDGRLGPVADEGVLDPELDGDRAVLQREALDLADLDAGDADRVVGLQAGRLGELRPVDGAAADQRAATAR